MNKLKSVLLCFVSLIIFALPFASISASQVLAQDAGNKGNETNSSGQTSILCTFFPFLRTINFARGLCGDLQTQSASAIDLAVDFGRFGLSLIFIGIIAIAVFQIIKAAIVYIRSEGDGAKVEDAQKSIKNVFLGIGALLIGIIGLVIILGLANVQTTTDPIPQPIEDILR